MSEPFKEGFYLNKKCKLCGKRLTVCEKESEALGFRRLNLTDPKKKSRYYCPDCEKYFAASDTGGDYRRNAREIPKEKGKRYHFLKSSGYTVVSHYPLKVIFVLLLVTLAVILGTSGAKNDIPFMIIGATFCGAGGLILAYYLISARRNGRAQKNIYFELLKNGLIYNNGKQKSYYEWEDFRIISQARRGKKGEFDAYAFDTKEKAFLISQDIENYEELRSTIIDKVRGTAKIMPGL